MGISLNIYTFAFSRYLYYIVSMLNKIMHKPEQQIFLLFCFFFSNRANSLAFVFNSKITPGHILHNINLYVIIKCISVGIQSAYYALVKALAARETNSIFKKICFPSLKIQKTHLNTLFFPHWIMFPYLYCFVNAPNGKSLDPCVALSFCIQHSLVL